MKCDPSYSDIRETRPVNLNICCLDGCVIESVQTPFVFFSWLTAFGLRILFLQNCALVALGTGIWAGTSIKEAMMGLLGRSADRNRNLTFTSVPMSTQSCELMDKNSDSQRIIHLLSWMSVCTHRTGDCFSPRWFIEKIIGSWMETKSENSSVAVQNIY